MEAKEERCMKQITKQEIKNLSLANLTLKSYHEMLDQHVVEVSELERLKINMKQLEDLHGRLAFTMTEIKSLMKRS